MINQFATSNLPSLCFPYTTASSNYHYVLLHAGDVEKGEQYKTVAFFRGVGKYKILLHNITKSLSTLFYTQMVELICILLLFLFHTTYSINSKIPSWIHICGRNYPTAKRRSRTWAKTPKVKYWINFPMLHLISVSVWLVILVIIIIHHWILEISWW